MWHGSSQRFDTFGAGYSDERALFGLGVYTTDDMSVAVGYSRKKALPSRYLPPWIAPSEPRERLIYNVVWRGENPPRILDLEATMPDEVRGVARSVADSLDYPWVTNELPYVALDSELTVLDELVSIVDDPASTFEDFYRKLVRVFAESEQPSTEFIDILQKMSDDLVEAGVDAFRYTGGKRVGKGHLHEAMVWLDSESVEIVQAGNIEGLLRGSAGGVAREAGEAAVRGDPAAGAWREGYPEAELVPIEFFDDMQLEDEFFDRDLVIGGDVYDPQVWLERPGAVAGEGMEGLKRDMAEHGLDHPLTVRVDPESGAMNLVDGNHRVVAARELGWGSVPVVVERGDDITRIRPSQVGVPTAGGVARETGEAAPTLDEILEGAAPGGDPGLRLGGVDPGDRIDSLVDSVLDRPDRGGTDLSWSLATPEGVERAHDEVLQKLVDDFGEPLWPHEDEYEELIRKALDDAADWEGWGYDDLSGRYVPLGVDEWDDPLLTAGGVARETGEAAGRVSDEIEEWLADAPLAGEAEAFLKGRLSNQEVWDIIESKPEVRDIFLGNWDRMFREMREHGHIFGPDATASGRGYAERMGGGKFDPSNPEHLEEILSIGMPVDMQASLYLAGWGRPEGTKEAVEELLELLKRLEELGD